MAKYIERELALSFPFANGQYDHENANEHFILGCESYREWLENMVAVEVRPDIRGKWISQDKIFKGIPFECSICGEVTNETVMGKPRFGFCPMCGAMMGESDG